MKRILLTFLVIIGAGVLFAQNEVGTPEASDTTVGVPQQNLSEVSVDKFEMEGFWRSDMSTDTGFTVSRLFEGGPLNKTPIEGEAELDIPDNKVLGTKVDFLRRGYT
ncbi:MAG: flagellar filament protein FlaA, partial [Spirochaetaceae bacterium]|nr:flagellar filament protein FlaA [Spirochaetaceae bacterium]